MGLLTNIFNFARNTTLNGLGVERDLLQLIQDKDISRAKMLFQNRDTDVLKAISEYNPELHDVMKRPNKRRKGKEPYITQKLPRAWQRYINEIALFFLLAKPIRWTCSNLDENNSDAFDAFTSFLESTRFETTMRQAKRLAGSETECIKLYHIYRNNDNVPEVKVIVISKSLGYELRPLLDQYGNMVACGYGYYLKEGNKTVEHFDIQTSELIYRCKKVQLGWEVTTFINPTGKINMIYYNQIKEWDGADHRINRDEMVDSKSADTNEYFADPQAAATADVIAKLADPETVGKLIHLQGKDSRFEYVEPPTSSEMKESEKKVLRESILNDTFTPDFSFENMKGTGTLSGEALRRALILGYIKRDNRKETYDILVDREKSLILSIMMNITHIHLRDKLATLKIKHEFAEPFDEDTDKKWTSIGRAFTDGIISLETAVKLLAIANPEEEIERIKAAKVAEKEEVNYPIGGNEE